MTQAEIMKGICNSDALQLLKQLFISKNKYIVAGMDMNRRNVQLNKTKLHRQKILSDAQDIYHNISEERDYKVNNTMIRLYLHYNSPRQIFSIWNDIVRIQDNVEYDVLIQCYIKMGDNLDMDKGIEILKWMKRNEYYDQDKLSQRQKKNYSIFVSNLLTNCKELEDLERIQSSITDNQDIFIKTAFIHCHRRFGLIDDALRIFNDINDSDKILFASME